MAAVAVSATGSRMNSFDFEAGKRFLAEGDLVEALRCLRSALDENKDNVEIYVVLANAYIAAFEDSGDPLCLDSARKVCLAGLRREPDADQRRALFEIQNKVEDLILESEKAEMDAIQDAMKESGFREEDLPADAGGFPEEPGVDDLLAEEPPGERGH